jgi:hypothetical protein
VAHADRKLPVYDDLSTRCQTIFQLILISFHFAEHKRRRRCDQSSPIPQKLQKSTRDTSEIEPDHIIVTTSIIRNFNSTKFSFDDLQTPRVLGHKPRRLRQVHQVQQAPDRHSAVSAAHGHSLQAPQRHRDRLEQVNGVRETNETSPSDH